MTIHEIKQEKQDRVSLLIKECGVFFAFSEKQFYENKTPLSEGEKYVSMGAGGYIPKSNVEAYKTGINDIDKWYKAITKQTKQMRRENIAYELANHEAYYTCDISDTLEALGSEYTAKEVWKVYHEERVKQNDLVY
jgi:uncharacterized membrane protein